ncbi:diaminopimelate decarboxylase 1, chloroplastic-like isoform X2 [Homarus americanus]|uniref:diaminopimelate decarboxylase 1, chloroplastic-like isoform X2 n=1 Tax=Homarus americanus TaxID=6706 RepID=UPI001C451C8E|nr:diaminopimelate decarboxylase 1, chloroplastic-like isoform X2 [Homarus americanus]
MEDRGWVYKGGTLHCDGMSLERLREHLRQEFGHLSSPAFVYSSATLHSSVLRYKDALTPLGMKGVLSYSVKANSNPGVVEALREAGVTLATTVSGNEVFLALRAGFLPHQVILNGNGKHRWEVELGVRRGVLLNVDSVFDARQLVNVARELGVRARALVRLNPALDAHTHPYLATALADSKFGVEVDQVEEIRDSGWQKASMINLGGGLSVSYEPPIDGGYHQEETIPTSLINPTSPLSSKKRITPETTKGTPNSLITKETTPNKPRTKETTPNSSMTRENTQKSIRATPSSTVTEATPTPQELVETILPYLPEGATLVLEPGRSLVATAGVVMTEVMGVKTNAGREFVVVDAAMTEVIRPALYGVHHPICYVTTPSAHQEVAEVDVVGPVCESGDFLARRCFLPRPSASGDALVVWAAGAYCASMASNYNLRPHALEVLVHSPDSYKVLRRPQEFEDLVREFL